MEPRLARSKPISLAIRADRQGYRLTSNDDFSAVPITRARLAELVSGLALGLFGLQMLWETAGFVVVHAVR